jgi:hypothetical protein
MHLLRYIQDTTTTICQGTPSDGPMAALQLDEARGYQTAFDGVDRAFVLLPGGYTNAVEYLQPVIQAAADRRVKAVQTAIESMMKDSLSAGRTVLIRTGILCDSSPQRELIAS